jgi:hypothetical protein
VSAANLLQVLTAVGGNQLVQYNPLDIVRTPSSALTATIIGLATYYFYSQVSTLKDQLDLNKKALDQYATALASFGCVAYDPSNPKDSEKTQDLCIANIKKVEAERTSGNAVVKTLNDNAIVLKQTVPLDLSLGEDQLRSVSKIASFMSNVKFMLDQCHGQSQTMNTHLETAQTNAKLAIENASNFHKDTIQALKDANQAEASTGFCKEERGKLMGWYEKEKEMKDFFEDSFKTCDLNLKDHDADLKIEQDKTKYCISEKEKVSKERADVTSTLAICQNDLESMKKKYAKTWF